MSGAAGGLACAIACALVAASGGVRVARADDPATATPTPTPTAPITVTPTGAPVVNVGSGSATASVPVTVTVPVSVSVSVAVPVTVSVSTGTGSGSGSDADADALPDQIISAELGAASGGDFTPGGLRVSGHFLYQLSDTDWFDGAASFTFGGGSAGCFRDRSDAVICEHGLADGTGAELSAAVRRYFPAQGKFRPFARVGVGVEIAHYSSDQLTGMLIPLHLGGGVRAQVAPSIAIVGQAEISPGLGVFGRGIGIEPIFGIAITAGVEFSLQ